MEYLINNTAKFIEKTVINIAAPHKSTQASKNKPTNSPSSVAKTTLPPKDSVVKHYQPSTTSTVTPMNSKPGNPVGQYGKYAPKSQTTQVSNTPPQKKEPPINNSNAFKLAKARFESPPPANNTNSSVQTPKPIPKKAVFQSPPPKPQNSYRMANNSNANLPEVPVPKTTPSVVVPPPMANSNVSTVNTSPSSNVLKTYTIAQGIPREISHTRDYTKTEKVDGRMCYVEHKTGICYGTNPKNLACTWNHTQQYDDFLAEYEQLSGHPATGSSSLELSAGQIPGLTFLTPWTVCNHVEQFVKPFVNSLNDESFQLLGNAICDKDAKANLLDDIEYLLSSTSSTFEFGSKSRDQTLTQLDSISGKYSYLALKLGIVATTKEMSRLALTYAAARCNIAGSKTTRNNLEIFGSILMKGAAKGYWQPDEASKLCPHFNVQYWFLTDKEVRDAGMYKNAREYVPSTYKYTPPIRPHVSHLKLHHGTHTVTSYTGEYGSITTSYPTSDWY